MSTLRVSRRFLHVKLIGFCEGVLDRPEPTNAPHRFIRRLQQYCYK